MNSNLECASFSAAWFWYMNLYHQKRINEAANLCDSILLDSGIEAAARMLIRKVHGYCSGTLKSQLSESRDRARKNTHQITTYLFTAMVNNAAQLDIAMREQTPSLRQQCESKAFEPISWFDDARRVWQAKNWPDDELFFLMAAFCLRFSKSAIDSNNATASALWMCWALRFISGDCIYDDYVKSVESDLGSYVGNQREAGGVRELAEAATRTLLRDGKKISCSAVWGRMKRLCDLDGFKSSDGFEVTYLPEGNHFVSIVAQTGKEEKTLSFSTFKGKKYGANGWDIQAIKI